MCDVEIVLVFPSPAVTDSVAVNKLVVCRLYVQGHSCDELLELELLTHRLCECEYTLCHV